MIILTTTLFGTIRFYPLVSQGWKNVISYGALPSAYLVFATWNAIFYPAGANAQNRSKTFMTLSSELEILRRFTTKQEAKIMTAFFKSCSPLRIEVGNFYTYNNGSIPASFDYVTDRSITLLVSL
jgi:hypothetical protein